MNLFPASDLLLAHDPRALAKAATAVENHNPAVSSFLREFPGTGLVLGVTGPPGAGKSTLVDAIAEHLRGEGKTVAVLAVDPSSRSTGGAILGDRIRMSGHYSDRGIFIRSMATRGSTGGLAQTTETMARLFRSAGFDYIIIETVGVGQDEIAVAAVAQITIVVVVPGMGDDVQAIKAGVMEIADLFVINKSDRPGADQTEHDLQFVMSLTSEARQVPVVKTIAVTRSGIAGLIASLELLTPRQLPALPEQFQIDHLGIAVRSLDDSLPFYSALGLAAPSRESVAVERVNVAMFPVGDSRIELLEATDPESPIAKFVAKRGEGLHHVALRVPDLHRAAEGLRARGARLLNDPRAGAGGHLYIFIHPQSAGGVLWELIQE